MKYFDTEFRKFLEDLLGAFRKFLEQARMSSKDQNYIILVNETVGKIDKALKIVKPSAFDFLSVGKIQKLQEDEFLKQKAVELEQSFEERVKAETEKAAEELRKSIRNSLEKELEAKAESEKAAITEQLKSSIGAEYESEYAKKVADIEKEYAEKVAALRREYDEKLKAEIERITAELRIQIRDELSKSMSEELSQKLRKEIKAELKQEREEKKKRKKAKKAEMMAEQNLPENAVPVPSSETEKTEAEIVNFRMTPEEKKKLLAKAEEAHMSLSGYIISLSRSKRVVLKDEIGKLTVEISRIGNNINQIAHTGNSQKFLYKAQLNDVVKHLQAIEDLQRKIWNCQEKYSQRTH